MKKPFFPKQLDRVFIFFSYTHDRASHFLKITINSKKKDWAKVISSINGKNEEYIRKELSINFDDDTTINDMRIVAKTIDNLLPNITKKILNDIES